MDKVLDDGNEVLEGQVYDFAELEHVDRGLVPKSVDDEIMDWSRLTRRTAHG